MKGIAAHLLDGAALFLDFDGTLVELADTPDGISVPTALGPMLERLKRNDVVVSAVDPAALADIQRDADTAWTAIARVSDAIAALKR